MPNNSMQRTTLRAAADACVRRAEYYGPSIRDCMLRRLVCAGLLVGEAACWVLRRERQFFEPGLGLWFAPVRALRPLIHVVGQPLVLLLSFLGMLAGMLLVLGGI